MSTVEFRTIRLKQNMGHGNARRVSLKHSSNELVALMDADDISMPNRFELQLDHFLHNPSLSIVGGQITEFVNDPSNVVDQRVVPLDHVQIRKYLEKRCPMNQVTVMFKKSEVQRAGGYRDWYCDEDYYLWARMFLRGCRFENTPECLVNVRVGEDMSSRRGGLKYFNSEARMQTFLLQNKLINPFQWLYNVGLRFGGEVLLSNSLREQAFKLFRATPGNNSGQGQTLNSRSSENQNISRNKKMSYPPFSVAMCVYGKDNPDWFDIALNSIIDQTVKPNEIVLVVDGPVPKAIDDVIEKYKSICAEGGVQLRVIRSLKNRGLGTALRVAVKECSNELIARMDSDDISVPTRFEEQLRYFTQHPKTDIVGGNIAEFIGDESNVVGNRVVPTMNNEIREYMKTRCPFNHMSVMYKKSAVLDAGNYQDWFWDEDYYLWIRMWLKNCVFANTGTTLVHVRVGENMYQRRGGRKYYESEKKLQKYMLDHGMISWPIYVSNVAKRYVLQELLPNNVRAFVYKKFARN